MDSFKNVAFLYFAPGYKQCTTCRHMTNIICELKATDKIVGEDLKGECSGYRFSIIKAFKKVWRIK